MTLPKCCITCAFCLKKLYKGTPFETPVLRKITEEDAQNALNNNYDFLHHEADLFNDWEQEYNKRIKFFWEEQENIRKENPLNLSYMVHKQKEAFSDYALFEEVGMPAPPFGPVKKVYLCCAEKRFADTISSGIQKRPMFVNEFPCDFYFSIEERKEKDLDACRNERDLNRQKLRDELQEKRLKIELENAENMQKILSETKETLSQTDERIKNIVESIEKTNKLTKNIAEYTTRNEKSSKRYFWASLIVSIIAVIVALAGIYFNNQNQDANMFNLINIQKNK